LLNYPAIGVDGLTMSQNQFYTRLGPKKAFSIMKFKKKIKKDTSLLFDEKPQASQLPTEAFDFFKADDVTNCQSLLQHASGHHDDQAEGAANKGFF